MTVPLEGKIDFEKGGIIGMTIMVFSLSLIFFAIKIHRKTTGSGIFSFGQAFRVGILTTLIASIVYVVGWMVYFEFVGENFTGHYLDYCVEQINTNNNYTDSEKEIQKIELETGLKAYRTNVLTRIFYTFKEIFPIGFVITIISSLLLKKKGTTN